MTEIIKATIKDSKMLVQVAKESFLEPHGESASKADIDSYINNTFNEVAFVNELSDLNNLYYIISYKGKVAGYSKIILNAPHKDIESQNITKLERLYLLKEYYGKNIGTELFDFNIALSKTNSQNGIWLTVWIENHRAINFYKKAGFIIVGESDFVVSETHTNPQYNMYLNYLV